MKVLVVGGGGREHSLVWKIAASAEVEEVIAAPGNGGIAEIARCEPVGAEDVAGQIELARRKDVDLVVVGPEAPLVAGLADRLREAGIPAFGPSASAARLEGSKAFAKEFMRRHEIPTAGFAVHEDTSSALADVERRDGKCVIKADGLAAGKGVVLCRNAYEAREAVRSAMDEGRFGEAGRRVVIEDFLQGDEVSVLAICDGERFAPLISAQDHKAAYEGSTGPNTGGMGAYAPAPFVTDELRDEIVETVLRRTVEGMAADGSPFRGVLYAGLMICDGGPRVLEFNVRFGDPECQPLMMLLDEDLAPLLAAAAEARLEKKELAWREGASICVVLASDGYPGPYEKGKRISGLRDAARRENAVVFHAGTRREGDCLVTSGGRVLGVTAVGPDLKTAAAEAYAAAEDISWEGMRMRRDIGHRAL
ncbi:MAG: phosphoribosylamine--glycine ligase [Polyangia bacterium]